MDLMHVHNKFRYFIAKGDFNHIGLKNTPAANMHVLSYSKQLEFSAGCWARQCRKDHSGCRAVKEDILGEIVCSQEHIDLDDSLLHITSLRLLKACLEEKVRKSRINFTHSVIDSLQFPSGHTGLINLDALQIMWADTRYVGCSRVKFQHPTPSRMVFLQVCHYFPRANSMKHPIFVRGEPTSKCQHGESATPQYSTLCGDIRPIKLDNWQAMKGNRNTWGFILSLHLLYLQYIFR
ncbi:hypothetical protein Trydic_g8971 [Trypoxylus dichotomus]